MSRRGLLRVLLGATLVLALTLTLACSPENEVQIAFEELTRIREQKKVELEEYFAHIERIVSSAGDDRVLLNTFATLNRWYRQRDGGQDMARDNTKEDTYHTVSEVEEAILQRYVERYQIFFDIHFIDAGGDVFYSVLKQADLFQNIFEGELRDTALARKLSQTPRSSAVDFSFPGFGSEASAFFIHPVEDDGEHLGWIAFQFASSRLREIFAHEDDLGSTGEVFLVNRDHFMLTDSYHSARSSVLRRHLSAENIEGKFREREGEKTVVDYRGYEVLTSFEVCKVMGFEWLLITKIDLDEVITAQYRRHPSRYHDDLRAALRTLEPRYTAEAPAPGDYRRVHLDGFERATSGGLYTPGVATCTSLVVSLPGEFTYMAHVSPYDRIYGGERTDLVRSVLSRVHDFEVADNALREVRAVIVTPRIRYSERIVDELVRAGLLLSQITFMKNPDARCADVYHNVSEQETYVTWCFGDDYQEQHVQIASRTPSLAQIMEQVEPELSPSSVAAR